MVTVAIGTFQLATGFHCESVYSNEKAHSLLESYMISKFRLEVPDLFRSDPTAPILALDKEQRRMKRRSQKGRSMLFLTTRSISSSPVDARLSTNSKAWFVVNRISINASSARD